MQNWLYPLGASLTSLLSQGFNMAGKMGRLTSLRRHIQRQLSIWQAR